MPLMYPRCNSSPTLEPRYTTLVAPVCVTSTRCVKTSVRWRTSQTALTLHRAKPGGAKESRGGKILRTHGAFCTELRNVFIFQITSSLSTSRHEGMPASGLPWVTVT